MAWLFQYFEFVSVECIMYAQRLNEIQNECINKQMRKRAYPQVVLPHRGLRIVVLIHHKGRK